MPSRSPSGDVVVAEFNYRHEAEFAAGFLDDAGIPYRLQTDDAGGVDIGVGMGRPARLWVCGEDADEARDLLEVTPNAAVASVPDDQQEDDEAPPTGLFMPRSDTAVEPRTVARGERRIGRPSLGASKLCGAERAVALTLGALLVALGQGVVGGVPQGQLGEVWAALVGLFGAAFVLSGLVGRSWGPLRSLLRTLSGVAP